MDELGYTDGIFLHGRHGLLASYAILRNVEDPLNAIVRSDRTQSEHKNRTPCNRGPSAAGCGHAESSRIGDKFQWLLRGSTL